MTDGYQRILIVDDNLSIQGDFAKILGGNAATHDPLDDFEAAILGDTALKHGLNFELAFASQGQQALAMVTEAISAGNRFALAFIDMRMPPGWDGLETIEHLWAVDPDLQVVICSAYSDHSWTDLQLRLGKDRPSWQSGLLVIKKPFDTIEVLQSAHALTEKWRLGQESRMRVDHLESAVLARTEQLRQINAQLAEQLKVQEVARFEQERLANELDRRNFAMAFVLDNVDQGLFTVDLDGRIADERSATVVRLLGAVPVNNLIVSYVQQFAPEYALWFELCWSSLRDSNFSSELALGQLPRTMLLNGRHLEFEFKLVTSNSLHQVVVVVVTDVTARVLREQSECDHRELGALAVRLITDRQGFDELHSDSRRLLTAIVSGVHDPKSTRIPVHTLKGSAAMFGLGSVAELCHQIENTLESGEDIAPLVEKLADRWHYIEEELDPLTSIGGDRLDVDSADIDELLAALHHTENSRDVITIVESWRNQRARCKLERFADQARTLATQLGKDHLVEIDCGRMRLPVLGTKFWSSLVHVIRNAIDHGIESPSERIAAGKSTEPTLTLRAAHGPDGFVIEIADHGRGIDWSRLSEVANLRGLPAATHEQLVDALFTDGITTRESASTVSGRGIGLAAVRAAVDELGGTIAVTSEIGRGTLFRFTFSVAAQHAPGCRLVSSSPQR